MGPGLRRGGDFLSSYLANEICQFRSWRRKAWGFKSLHPHQLESYGLPSCPDIIQCSEIR